MPIHIKRTLTIKDDYKVIQAYKNGLLHGLMFKIIGLPANKVYTTHKENKAYKHAVKSINDDYINLYKRGCRELELIEMAIEKGDIINIGWRIARCKESDFKPFIE